MTQTTTGLTARLVLTMSERTTGLAAGLAQGIDPKQASSQPTFGDSVVNCNHPTFIYGHLALYPSKILQALGLDSVDADVPESYSELFEAGKDCKHDPDCTIYPAFEEVLAAFQQAHKVVHERLATLDDETLAKAIEGNGRAAEFFGTCDTMAIFMLHDHYMFHLGQLSTWRRCFGLGSVMG